MVLVEMAAAVTGTSKNENSEGGVFSVLYSLQFQEGRTKSLFSWLIVVFCFVFFIARLPPLELEHESHHSSPQQSLPVSG